MKNHVRFTIDDANKAGNEWHFNCGPRAICAVMNLTLDKARFTRHQICLMVFALLQTSVAMSAILLAGFAIN